jgi:hypothetical protein
VLLHLTVLGQPARPTGKSCWWRPRDARAAGTGGKSAIACVVRMPLRGSALYLSSAVSNTHRLRPSHDGKVVLCSMVWRFLIKVTNLVTLTTSPCLLFFGSPPKMRLVLMHFRKVLDPCLSRPLRLQALPQPISLAPRV